MKAAYFYQKKLVKLNVRVYKKQVHMKSYSLKIRIDSVKKILRNKETVTVTRDINTLTKIKDQKIPCVYSCLSNNKKLRTSSA